MLREELVSTSFDTEIKLRSFYALFLFFKKSQTIKVSVWHANSFFFLQHCLKETRKQSSIFGLVWFVLSFSFMCKGVLPT